MSNNTINPQYEQVLAEMSQENGFTKEQLRARVNINKFNKYCKDRYKDKPRCQEDRKYRITYSQDDHAYQCKFLGRIYEGIEAVVVKKAEHIALTSTDPYVIELCVSLGITTNRRHLVLHDDT